MYIDILVPCWFVLRIWVRRLGRASLADCRVPSRALYTCPLTALSASSLDSYYSCCSSALHEQLSSIFTLVGITCLAIIHLFIKRGTYSSILFICSVLARLFVISATASSKFGYESDASCSWTSCIFPILHYPLSSVNSD